MSVVHESSAGETTVLASDVEFADGVLGQARGLMFRRSIPRDYALVFRFGRTRKRGLHMVFVPFAVDAVWLQDGLVQRVKRLSAWVGAGWATADCIVEFPAGTADAVEPGDEIRIEADNS